MTHGTTLPVRRGIWYVAIAATAWGTGGTAAAVLYGITDLDPVTVSWWRFLSGALLLAAVRRRFGPGTPFALRRWDRATWRLVLVTGAGLAVYQTAYYLSINLCGLAVATVVTLGAGPVLIAVAAHATGLERVGPRGAAAVAAALAGLVLLAGTGGTGNGPLAGIALALVSAAGYAAVTLLTRRGGDLPRYDAALAGFAVGAVLLAPAADLGTDLGTTAPATAAALLAYLTAVPSALAYLLFFKGLAVVRATTASVVALVEPLTATLAAVALLGEPLPAPAAAGGALLLAAVAALAHAETRARDPKEA